VGAPQCKAAGKVYIRVYLFCIEKKTWFWTTLNPHASTDKNRKPMVKSLVKVVPVLK
jgi:hypothetical protein